MTNKPWLTHELDQTSYTFNKEKFNEYIKSIHLAEKRSFIENKLKDEDLKTEITSTAKKRTRFVKAAKSFLTLEGKGLSFPLQDDSQKLSLEDYYEACVKAYELSQQPFFMPTINDMLELNAILLRHDEETSKYPKFSLRNEKSPLIVIGKGYFEPVKNEDVGKKATILL